MSVVGTWVVFYDWQCTGTYGQAKIEFKNDGTVDVDGAIGQWAEEAGMVIMRFTEGPGAVYTANRVQHSMTGISSVFSGFNGCWYALRDSTFSTPEGPGLGQGAHRFTGEKR